MSRISKSEIYLNYVDAPCQPGSVFEDTVGVLVFIQFRCLMNQRVHRQRGEALIYGTGEMEKK